ncbi:ABC transporter permease [Mesorhizobium sp. BAC0120]|uniref:ABC transporter permease n=1 Tax=Mesorhizobium sp. BAC0120 TaxID=3090670 RepID=UPI00298C78AA|nr:ABC transporter permease [Mesorhizobium sp. BAC0120]MDW6020982.1 ABC transporter permease [Mesorhizobium sp. BAC0120]
MSTADNTANHRPADFEASLASAPAAVASFEEEHKSAMRRVQHFLHQFPTMVPFVVLLIGIAAFTIPVPRYVDGELQFAALAGARFFSAFNLSLILQQVTIIAVLGIAQTLVILTAGIDLSVGVIMILCSVVMGRTCVIYGVPLWIAFPLGLLVGLLCGLVNGVIVTALRLPPFIVTLGTWSIFGALNVFYSRSETIRQQDIEASAPFLQWTGTIIKPYDLILNTIGIEVGWLKGSVITYGSLLMVLLAIAVWYMLNRTAFGRHIYATGDEPDSARLAGINTDRTLVAVYTIAGLICAIAAWVLIGRIGGVSPQAGQTANLDSITAVVIGGTSLFGGRGSIIGTLIGALIVGVFRNGLALSGLEVLWQDFTVGVLIIVAVTLDQWIRKISA